VNGVQSSKTRHNWCSEVVKYPTIVQYCSITFLQSGVFIIYEYYIVLAVLVRFTEHTTLFVTLFYCRLHESVLQSPFTLSTDPLMSWLGAVP
jgi:hypothetical protein